MSKKSTKDKMAGFITDFETKAEDKDKSKIETVKREVTSEERQKAIKDSTEFYSKGSAKPGSLAAKARMVEQFNEKSKK